MRCRILKLAVLIMAVSCWPAYLASVSTEIEAASAAQQRRPRTGGRAGTGAAQTERAGARFSHSVPQHRQQACDACHKLSTPEGKETRKGDEAFPDVIDYPGHASCLDCHRRQFFTGAQPAICTVCHTNPGPRNAERRPFPNPVERPVASTQAQAAGREFDLYFPHETHQGMIGRYGPFTEKSGQARIVLASHRQEGQAESNRACPTCHQTYQPQGESDEEFVTKPPANLSEDAFWLKKGTFKTYPAGHAACFTCHSQDGGIEPASPACASCHKAVNPSQRLTLAESDFDLRLAATMGITDRKTLEKWRKRQSSRYRHEWISHADLDCTSCHTVTAINTVDGKGAVVPVLSCGGGGTGCHITATTGEGGILNSEVDQKKAKPSFECAKCHITLGKRPVPESHIDAISATKSKQ